MITVLRSYPEGFAAAIVADQLWAKQQERDSKKQAIATAVVPPVEVPVAAAPAAVQPVEAPVVAPETTGSKQRKKDAALEQVLEAKASY